MSEQRDSDRADGRADRDQLVRLVRDQAENTVLVVDDEAMVRRMVSRSIKAQAPVVDVVQAEHGEEALRCLTRIRETTGSDPALIVTDLEMPIMDGWEFIEKLRQDYVSRGLEYGIPVIVLSSSTGEKGLLFKRKSVHGGKSRYTPIGTVAKEACMQPGKYDATGGKGLSGWLEYFLRQTAPGTTSSS